MTVFLGVLMVDVPLSDVGDYRPFYYFISGDKVVAASETAICPPGARKWRPHNRLAASAADWAALARASL